MVGVWRIALRIALLVAAALAPAPALAQGYPTKPIRLVVGVPPGGASDAVARIVAQKLSEQLGQAVVIENRGGASGNIAAEIVARAAPDGYTLLLATVGTMAINPSLFKDTPFDTVRDFAPISQLTSMPQVLLVHPSVPAKTVQEFIAYTRAHPGLLNFASGGSGTATHLAGELFAAMSGTTLVHVPYKGNAPAMTDLLSGSVSVMFDQLPSGLPHVANGRLRALGVTTAKRTPAAPDIPTISESGLAGYDVTTWHGLVAPAGTSPAIVNRLHQEVVRALELPDVRQKFAANGIDPVTSTPAQFAAFMKTEIRRWDELVKASGAAAN